MSSIQFFFFGNFFNFAKPLSLVLTELIYSSVVKRRVSSVDCEAARVIC